MTSFKDTSSQDTQDLALPFCARGFNQSFGERARYGLLSDDDVIDEQPQFPDVAAMGDRETFVRQVRPQ